MTTLNDIYILQRVAEKAAEKYNRRCRRLVALYRAGRKVARITGITPTACASRWNRPPATWIWSSSSRRKSPQPSLSTTRTTYQQ